jgi:hypothetical protein
VRSGVSSGSSRQTRLPIDGRQVGGCQVGGCQVGGCQVGGCRPLHEAERQVTGGEQPGSSLGCRRLPVSVRLPAPVPCQGDNVADGVTWAGVAQSVLPGFVGAVIGSGATILAGYLTWKRERVDRDDLAKREAEVKAEEAHEAHRSQRATALLNGLAQATTAMFEAASASDRATKATTSPVAQQARREAVAKANIAVYRLLSLTRSDRVRVEVRNAAGFLAVPGRLSDGTAQGLIQLLTDAVLAEHDALQPVASVAALTPVPTTDE